MECPMRSTMIVCLILGYSVLIHGAPLSGVEDGQKAKKEASVGAIGGGGGWNHGHQELRWNSQLSPVDIDIPYKRDTADPADIHYQLSPVDLDIPYKRNAMVNEDDDQQQLADEPPMAVFVPVVVESRPSRMRKRTVETTIVDLNTLERIMAAGRR